MVVVANANDADGGVFKIDIVYPPRVPCEIHQLRPFQEVQVPAMHNRKTETLTVHKPGRRFAIRVTYDGDGFYAIHLRVDGRPARPFSMMHVFGAKHHNSAIFQGFMDEFGTEFRFEAQAVPTREMTDDEIERMRQCQPVDICTGKVDAIIVPIKEVGGVVTTSACRPPQGKITTRDATTTAEDKKLKGNNGIMVTAGNALIQRRTSFGSTSKTTAAATDRRPLQVLRGLYTPTCDGA